MKKASDPRHRNRIKTVKSLFATSFLPKQSGLTPLSKEIFSKVGELDEIIKNGAPTWPIEKINRVDLAILRLAVYEIKFTKTPPKVAIDEAVELAKEFGSENSGSFVNGALGAIYGEGETK